MYLGVWVGGRLKEEEGGVEGRGGRGSLHHIEFSHLYGVLQPKTDVDCDNRLMLMEMLGSMPRL